MSSCNQKLVLNCLLTLALGAVVGCSSASTEEDASAESASVQAQSDDLVGATSEALEEKIEGIEDTAEATTEEIQKEAADLPVVDLPKAKEEVKGKVESAKKEVKQAAQKEAELEKKAVAEEKVAAEVPKVLPEKKKALVAEVEKSSGQGYFRKTIKACDMKAEPKSKAKVLTNVAVGKKIWVEDSGKYYKVFRTKDVGYILKSCFSK